MSPALAALVLVAAGSAAGAGAWSHLTRRRVQARLAADAPAALGTTIWPAGPFSTRAGAASRGDAPAWPTPVRLVAAGVGVAIGLAGLVAAVGPMVLIAGALAGLAFPVARHHRRRADSRRLRRVQLPAALERLATALRAGSSVPAALAEVGRAMPAPIGPELAALGREADAGRAVVDVLDGWSARHDDAGTRLAATALALATAVGGAPGHAVDGVAATLRERVGLADERRALASQARMSALVLAVAPVGFTVLLGAADGAASAFLLGSPAGWTCLAAGLGLDGLGAWWMARLTRGDET